MLRYVTCDRIFMKCQYVFEPSLKSAWIGNELKIRRVQQSQIYSWNQLCSLRFIVKIRSTVPLLALGFEMLKRVAACLFCPPPSFTLFDIKSINTRKFLWEILFNFLTLKTTSLVKVRYLIFTQFCELLTTYTHEFVIQNFRNLTNFLTYEENNKKPNTIRRFI